MNQFISYPIEVFKGFASLLRGMHRTLMSMLHPSRILTQQYPEHRDTLVIPERFKGELVLLKDDSGRYKCTACTLCQSACPNGSIVIETEQVEVAEGKSKKQLKLYHYNLGSCTFCGLCVESCHFEALAFTNSFELAQYDKHKLHHRLNASS